MRIVRSKIPGLDGLPLVEYRRRVHALKREANRELMLTHDGKPRQRGFWNRYPDLDHLPARARLRIRQQRWAQRQSPNALELAYRALRNSVVPETDLRETTYYRRNKE